MNRIIDMVGLAIVCVLLRPVIKDNVVYFMTCLSAGAIAGIIRGTVG